MRNPNGVKGTRNSVKFMIYAQHKWGVWNVIETIHDDMWTMVSEEVVLKDATRNDAIAEIESLSGEVLDLKTRMEITRIDFEI